MKIIYHEIISWEPLQITLVSKSNELSGLQTCVENWLYERDKARKCECHFKYLDIHKQSEKVIGIRCQWLCSTCLPELFKRIEDKFPSVKRAELGFSPDEESETSSFIQIPAKEIVFENGEAATVSSFWISLREVTVGEYVAFSKATGYRTVAEKQDDTVSVYMNSGLWGFSRKAQLCCTASHLSYIDALAYCEWAKLRLPTEAEIFAASLVDMTVHDEYDALQQNKVQMLLKEQKLPQFSGSTLTSTLDNGLVVARMGPSYVLTKGWEQRLRYDRRMIEPDFYDAITCFHVCK